MQQQVRRILTPLAILIVAALLGVAIYVSIGRSAGERTARAVLVTNGVVGSEKASFFTDPDVVAEFRKNGIDIHVTTQGSREQAQSGTKDGSDFYFPAGEPAGRALAKRLGVTDATTPFYTPIVIASWEPIAKILEANKIVRRASGFWYVVDMPKLLELEREGKRWTDLPGNTAYPVGKSILLSSTDARKSNSADMYLALASYIFNGNNIVTTADQAHRIQPQIDALFLRQGFQESSSAGPFDDYVTIGMGKTPMVIAYEQQWIEYAASHPAAQRPSGMALLYPQPTIITKHTLVPTNDKGRKVAQLLVDDVTLRQLEIKHGFRNADTAAMQAFWKSASVEPPTSLIDVVEPPSFEMLETLIQGVERAYQQQQ